MAAPNNPTIETKAQKDACFESSLQDHHRILIEFSQRMVAAEEHSIANEERNCTSFYDINMMFASLSAQQAKTIRIPGILWSSTSPSRAPPNTPSQSRTAVTHVTPETMLEEHGNTTGIMEYK